MIGMAPLADYPAIYLGYITYALVILIYARWLRHLFGSRTQRFGWLLLAGQLLLLTMHGWPIGPHSWWNHDAEHNIPVAFATFQVLSGSFCALAIAILSPLRPRWLRGYWVLISLGLFVLAQDEFGVLHDRFPILEEFYLIGGALVAGLSVIVWRHLDSRGRRYLYLLIAGLGVSVIGAEVLDKTPEICLDGWKILSTECIRFHPLDESFEKLGAWFVVLTSLGFAEQSIPSASWQRAKRPMLLVFGLVVSLSLRQGTLLYARLELYEDSLYNRRDRFYTQFANGYILRGSILRNLEAISNDSSYTFELFGQSKKDIDEDFGYAIHIVDQASEAVYAAHNHWSRRAAKRWLPGRIYKEYQKLWIPEDVPPGRALWFVFSLWEQTNEGEFVSIPITSSDQDLLSDTQAVLREFIVRVGETSVLPDNALKFYFSNGFALRGAQIPDSAHLGETLTIPMTWEAATDGEEDWVQFLHFVHEESGALWNHDQQPLGARLPTRLWYEGMLDSETWQFTLPAELPPGRYAIYTGLYRLSDLARLPVTDADGKPLPDARVPMGSIAISG